MRRRTIFPSRCVLLFLRSLRSAWAVLTQRRHEVVDERTLLLRPRADARSRPPATLAPMFARLRARSAARGRFASCRRSPSAGRKVLMTNADEGRRGGIEPSAQVPFCLERSRRHRFAPMYRLATLANASRGYRLKRRPRESGASTAAETAVCGRFSVLSLVRPGPARSCERVSRASRSIRSARLRRVTPASSNSFCRCATYSLAWSELLVSRGRLAIVIPASFDTASMMFSHSCCRSAP